MDKEATYDALYEVLRMVADSGDFQCFDDAAWEKVNKALDAADNLAFVPID